jgi:hypothetical protein
MRHVVIGVPARNEGETIAALCDALDHGASLLGEVATAEIVLAYQDSDDDTLHKFRHLHTSTPRRVLRCPPGAAGKGRNLKLLIEHAVSMSADLLLVDGDMRDYSPYTLARFVAAGYDGRYEQVLPLWCRPWGHANVTNHLAAPALAAMYGAQVRQPLAGHRFVSRAMLRRVDLTDLPDDYGIDVALTMAVLDSGGRTGQVVMEHIEHDDRQLNSEAIMVEVAAALLARFGRGPTPDRRDVVAPTDYAHRLRWSDEHTPSSSDTAVELEARDHWIDALAGAIRAARAGADVRDAAAALVGPFAAHADARRRRPRPDVGTAEAYVWQLGNDLAALLR